MQQKNDILLTGGHAATTSIAVIEELKKRYPDYNLFWVGPKSAVEGKFVPTLASLIMPKMGVKFIPITAGRLQKRFTVWTIPSILKIPVGFFQAFKILLKLKPKIVVSFGGFAAVPVCFAAWIMKIPVFVHEQTVAVGRANKVSAIFAKKILISRSESTKYFSPNKTVLIGNPISEEISKIQPKLKLSKMPVIYITGGSSGAQRINKVVAESLYELLQKYKIIHQTGKLDFEEFKKRKNEFPTDLKKNYEVYDFIDPKEIPGIYEKSDIIITRAGANTLSEIMVIKRPAIIIPIPWTAFDEQLQNAKKVVESGIGVLVEEKDLNPQYLIARIEFVVKNWEKMVKNSDSTLADLDKNAARKFVDEICENF